MENAGAVTFIEDYVFRSKVTRASYERRAETVLHEMAHMWFGDLVTMRWWDDLWLNESFATFASVLCQSEATEFTEAWTSFANAEKSWAYRQDQLPSTHPVAADIPDLAAVEVNFDGITYAKGPACSNSWWPTSGSTTSWPAARLLQNARLQQRNVRRPAGGAGDGVRPRPFRLGSAVAENHRAEHAAGRFRRRRRWPVHPICDPPEWRPARRR
ncbi:peptidase M1 family protein [Mycobacterium xenopi 4042]|uniref:Aminopeptidase N n=1 Tax=Mycobacterium xenopi 4042 TaxID=1299334 RepID=X8AQ56_MYCXE|nr:peptidase M1 family protein [Mycobacterium xenopi 4042]